MGFPSVILAERFSKGLLGQAFKEGLVQLIDDFVHDEFGREILGYYRRARRGRRALADCQGI